MGGGAVIRTVGKFAWIGAAASRGFRGVQPAPPAEHSPRAMSRNVAAIVSSRSGAASSEDVSQVAVQRPQWEIDDWESDRGESDLVMTSGEPMPRAVFGPAPCFEEAKAATDELKDAVEKVYLSSPAAAGTAIAPPAPNHAVQAFKLLSQSPDARNVVASIVSDSDVYNAVLKNLALMDFFQTQTHKSTFKFPSEDSNMKNSVEDGTSGNKVSGLLQHRKHAAEGMVSKVSCLFQHIFGLKADSKTDVAGDK